MHYLETEYIETGSFEVKTLAAWLASYPFDNDSRLFWDAVKEGTFAIAPKIEKNQSDMFLGA